MQLPNLPPSLMRGVQRIKRAPKRSLALAVLLIAFLGLATPDLPAQELIAKYGEPPSKFMTLPSGAHVHYRDQGDPSAPTLVLLHGSNSSLHTWQPWVGLLSDSFRIVSFDFPGHGLTGRVPGDDYSVNGMANFVDAVRKQLGITHFFLAGNSMGGNIAWRVTVEHPEAVDKLILLDASGIQQLLPEDQQPKIPLGMRIARTPGLNLLMGVITPRRAFADSLHKLFQDQSKVDEAMIDRYYELLLYPGNRTATRYRASASPNNAELEKLASIKAPTLLLWGEKDPLYPPAAGRMFQSKIPGAKLIVYPHVGHIPMEEIPARSAADARAFLLQH